MLRRLDPSEARIYSGVHRLGRDEPCRGLCNWGKDLANLQREADEANRFDRVGLSIDEPCKEQAVCIMLFVVKSVTARRDCHEKYWQTWQIYSLVTAFSCKPPQSDEIEWLPQPKRFSMILCACRLSGISTGRGTAYATLEGAVYYWPPCGGYRVHYCRSNLE
jgi:hypothetical protein